MRPCAPANGPRVVFGLLQDSLPLECPSLLQAASEPLSHCAGLNSGSSSFWESFPHLCTLQQPELSVPHCTPRPCIQLLHSSHFIIVIDLVIPPNDSLSQSRMTPKPPENRAWGTCIRDNALSRSAIPGKEERGRKGNEGKHKRVDHKLAKASLQTDRSDWQNVFREAIWSYWISKQSVQKQEERRIYPLTPSLTGQSSATRDVNSPPLAGCLYVSAEWVPPCHQINTC